MLFPQAEETLSKSVWLHFILYKIYWIIHFTSTKVKTARKLVHIEQFVTFARNSQYYSIPLENETKNFKSNHTKGEYICTDFKLGEEYQRSVLK